MWFYKRKLTMAPRKMLVLVEYGDSRFVVEVSPALELLTPITPELEIALKANSDCWAFVAPIEAPQIVDVVETAPIGVVESAQDLTPAPKRRGRPAKTSK